MCATLQLLTTLCAALARAEDKEAACLKWGKMLPVYYDLRDGVHNLLKEASVQSSEQQRHSRPPATSDIKKMMDIFGLRHVWSKEASELEWKQSGRYPELDRRGADLSARFIHSWLKEGRPVMNMQLISEKEALEDG